MSRRIFSIDEIVKDINTVLSEAPTSDVHRSNHDWAEIYVLCNIYINFCPE